jgi:signal transduction histidine kinase/ActR/RegA family two-component response regulator
MRPFKDLPIGTKAALLGLLPTVCALLVASLAFLASVYLAVRRNVTLDVATSAAVIADSVNLAVSVNDANTVRELAGALREKHNIDRACVFDASGTFIGGYTAPDSDPCPKTMVSPTRTSGTQVVSSQDILIGSRRVGTVRIVGNFDQVYQTLAAQTVVTVLALTGAIGLALVLIGWLRRGISQPVTELAATADQVSRTGDYALRARRTTGDEVGRLVQSFNTMLGAIQRSEAERSQLLEREREASRLKDEFLAAVSHELRTPLNAIVGWTHILTTTRPTPELLDKGLKTLHRNAKAQTRLIEDLIEVSRVATGKLNLKLEVVDLRDVVRQAVESLHGGAAAKPVTLDTTLPVEPALVSGDRDRLLQVVANLVSNAIKFTPEGGSVSVTLAPVSGDFVLRVRDTGIGIAPEFLPFVFERFRQADGSTTREYGGLGLGLSIVQDLVRLHRGSVSAQSEGRGKGSEFTVRLPALVDRPAADHADSGTESTGHTPDLADLADNAHRAHHADARAGDLEDVTVLAVDDNADALEVLAMSLRGAGAHVRTASSGAEAVAEWSREPGAVLVCDLGMAGMDGFEVLRRIRSLDNASGRRTFAIAVTAYASPDYIRRTREAGFDAHLAKPFDSNELLHHIAAALT